MRSCSACNSISGATWAVVYANQPADSSELSDRLSMAVTDRLMIDGRSMQVGVSIGIAIFPIDGDDRDQILANADVAMFCAKSAGRSAICFFEHEMDDTIRRRLNERAGGLNE